MMFFQPNQERKFGVVKEMKQRALTKKRTALEKKRRRKLVES
jgi:hypothetical protein